ncbi:MAG: hypothetical protein Q9160_005357 [Pyrenula sp. 1 TL-2023]
MQNTYPTTPDFNNIASLSALQTSKFRQPDKTSAGRRANGPNGVKAAASTHHSQASPQNVNNASFTYNGQVQIPSYNALSSQPMLPVEPPSQPLEPLTKYAHQHVPLPGLSFSQTPSLSQSQNEPNRPFAQLSAPSAQPRGSSIHSGQVLDSHQDRISSFLNGQDAKERTPEEGELSDGELQEDEPSPPAPVQARTVSRSQAPLDNEYSNTETGTTSQPIRVIQGRASANQTHTNVGDNRFVSNMLTATYNPPSASTPERPVDSKSFITQTMDPFEHTGSNNSDKPNADSRKYGNMYHGKSIQQWRDLAKQAVLSLVSYDIRYEDLIREGINAALLQELYRKPGIKGALAPEHVPTISNDTAALIAEPSKSKGVTLPTDGSASSQKPVNSRKEIETGESLQREASDPLHPKTSRVTQYPAAKPSPTNSTHLQTQLASTPAAPPLSRKDLIAQRLAARNDKTIVSQSPETVPIPTTLSKQASSPKLSAPAVELDAETATIESQTKIVSPILPSKPSPPSTSRPKSKAQTDLVRQRMELLKRQAPVKADAKPSQQGSGTSASDSTPMVLPLQHSSIIPALPETQTPVTPPAFHPHASFGSQIPGLFLASPDLDELISSAKQQVPADETVLTETDVLIAPARPGNLPPKPEFVGTDLPPELPLLSTTTGEGQALHNSAPTITKDVPSPQFVPRDRQPQKRPLASDSFDDFQPPHKRPFGRKESYDNVEIVVSDNEEDESSGDVDMDLDEQSETNSRSGQDTGFGSMTDHNFISKTVYDTPQEVLSHQVTYQSSPIAQTPTRDKEKGDPSKTKSLENAERDIAEMRRRIAEKEARNRAKKAAGRADSPKSSAPSTPINARMAEATPVAQSSPEPLSTTSTPLPALGDPARAEVLRQKLLRRRQIQTGLPGIDAKVESSRALLAQKQAELVEARKREAEMLQEAERLEASIREDLEHRSRLVGELEQLGVNVENKVINKIPTNVLEAKVNQLLDQQAREASPLSHSFPKATTSEAALPYDENAPEMDIPQQTLPEDLNIETPGSVDANTTSLTQASKPSTESGTSDDVSRQIEIIATAATGNSPGGVALPTEESPGLGFDASQDSDGSISMSDGDSDAYEPIEAASDVEDIDSDPYEPPDLSAADVESNSYRPEARVQSQSQSQIDDDDDAMSIDDDSYEPAEESPITEDFPDDSNQVPTPAPLTNGIDSIEQSNFIPSGAATDDVEDTSPLIDPEKVTELSVPAPATAVTPQLNENESQPPAAQDSRIGHLFGPARTKSDPTFHPYDSPFTKLRNFRFSEHFLDAVPGGYRSLTYSGRVNPDKFIYDKILVEMSSAKDFKDKDERERFVTGLKQVIADLRSRGVKEFTMVANELAAYRRRFQQSQTAEVSL